MYAPASFAPLVPGGYPIDDQNLLREFISAHPAGENGNATPKLLAQLEKIMSATSIAKAKDLVRECTECGYWYCAG